jgi:hypothetical protein
MRKSSVMNDRLWKFLSLALLAAILSSQWVIQILHHQEASRQLATAQSIESLLKHQSETTSEMVASLDDMADVIDDIHEHVDQKSQ